MYLLVMQMCSIQILLLAIYNKTERHHSQLQPVSHAAERISMHAKFYAVVMLLPCGKQRLFPSIVCTLPLKMPEQYFYYQRKYELCGFQAKKCVRIVAWLQMVSIDPCVFMLILCCVINFNVLVFTLIRTD